MKFYYLLMFVLILGAGGCTGSPRSEESIPKLPPEEVAVFTSTDQNLQKSFEWAKKTALSYSHNGQDPVGYWYEAALPKREAFCMRDVSHQSVGAQILGLEEHNKNMFSHFINNISESKDWCSYWEINRYDTPAPADYLNDKEFWYNLNANFDVLQACLKLFSWTGDREYISSPSFINFFERSTSEYVDRWKLSPDSLMHRLPHMNLPDNFDPENSFHTCRGVPSYVENLPGITVGVDLVASLYGGFMAYSEIAERNGNGAKAEQARQCAQKYREILEEQWWDNAKMHYNTGLLSNGKFTRGEGVPYILWFGATDNPERIRHSLADILSSDWNAENLSHFPELFYRYGYIEEAYDYLMSLPAMTRADYPEVSFGFIEGCVSGLMGFRPSYSKRTVETLNHMKYKEEEAEIKNIRVFDGYMTVRHSGYDYTKIINNTSLCLNWKASFPGDYSWIECNGRIYDAKQYRDAKGNVVSWANIHLPANSEVSAKALVRIYPEMPMENLRIPR